MINFVRVAREQELSDTRSKVVLVEERQIAIFKVDGKFYAIENFCPHRGGPVGEGDVEDRVVTCPWHGWRFDLRTGISPDNPAAVVSTFPVRVVNSEVQVGLE